ncbi:MAG: hypothetical protein MZV70_00815 [Desulfobacterales bacterium]|nr:hypothetical protein [Desulfobacterales bacterium]
MLSLLNRRKARSIDREYIAGLHDESVARMLDLLQNGREASVLDEAPSPEGSAFSSVPMFDKTYRSPSEALHLIISGLATTSPRNGDSRSWRTAAGASLLRISCRREDLPRPFRVPTVDGSSPSGAADTFGARETAPVYIAVRGEVVHGSCSRLHPRTGRGVARMPTGGMSARRRRRGGHGGAHPGGISDDMIEVPHAVAPSENVIQRGDDVRRGETVLMKGRRLRPQDIGALAGLGMTRVGVSPETRRLDHRDGRRDRPGGQYTRTRPRRADIKLIARLPVSSPNTAALPSGKGSSRTAPATSAR